MTSAASESDNSTYPRVPLQRSPEAFPLALGLHSWSVAAGTQSCICQ